MITTNDLNITQDGIPVFDTVTGSFTTVTVPNNQILTGNSSGTISGIDPSTAANGNLLVNAGIGIQPFFNNSCEVDSLKIHNRPVNLTDGATKHYVDTVASNFSYLDSTVCASTENLVATYNNGVNGVGATLTNASTLISFAVDSYAPSLTNRILIKNQNDATQNGIYTLTTIGDSSTAWVLTRAIDYDTGAEITPGSIASVLYGDTQSGTYWAQTQHVTNVGSQDIIFIKFFGVEEVLLAVNNLSDVENANASRQNLGITNVATQTVNQFSLLVGDLNNEIISFPTGQAGQILSSQGSGSQPLWVSPMPNSQVNQVNQIIYDTPGTYTYTPSANLLFAIVECAGGGGGAVGKTTGGTSPRATSGAGGGYAKSVVQSSTIGASQQVTVGAGGIGTSGSNANAGGTSSFGNIVTANGGGGGILTTSQNYNIVAGGSGTGNLVLAGGYNNEWFSGCGGKCFLSVPFTDIPINNGLNGQTGSGGCTPGTTFNIGTGGNGGNGLVIITEFIAGS